MKADVKSALDYMGSRGYPDPTMVRIIAIAYAESGASATTTHINLNGTTDYGFLQINSVHFGEPDFQSHGWNAQTMMQIGPNIDAAASVSKGWTYWKPWAAFNSGAYGLFIPTAQKDVADWHSGGGKTASTSGPGLIPDIPGLPGAGSNNPLDALKPVGAFFNAIGQPGTWLRVGYGALGILLVIVAAASLATNTGPGKAAKNLVTKVA